MKIGNRTTLSEIPRKTIDVPFPEMHTAYRLREMSGTERDTFEIAQFKEQSDGKHKVEPLYLRARLVALCLVDETGARLYADDEVQQLSDGVPAATIGKLFAAAQTLNGLDADAVDNAGKNSDAVPSGDSLSDLP
jgi:hypothetical protein